MKKKNTTTVVAAKVPRDKSSDMTTALTVRLNEIVFPKGVETLGQKANFLHGYSVEASKRANGAAIMAGWVLSVARSTCAHGQWLVWLAQNVSFSKRTADNYMSLYAQTLGKARAEARRPIALTVEPTVAELEAAAHDLDGKNMSQLYKSTRLIATPENWGGKDRGQGRKPKDADVAAQLDAVTKMESVLWAAAKGHLDELRKLDVKKDFMRRLSDEHLATVSELLSELAKKASELLVGRIAK